MKIAVYDHGLNTELAITLAKAKHSVGYFTPWDEAFPKSAKAIIGKGLEGLERITDWEKACDRADIIVFPDTFNGSKVDALRRAGKDVWGAGSIGERLEQDRIYMDQLQRTIGIPAPKRETIKGVEALIAKLKTTKNKWVKLSAFRGDKETFFHEEYSATQAQFLGQMFVDFGANEDLEFILEDPIDGDDVIEVGDDRLVVDGTFLSPRVIGYEAKDEAYLCYATTEQCPTLDRVNEGLEGIFRNGKVRTFFSTEVRGGKLIDPCVRCPHPPTSTMLALFSNIAEAVVNGAHGKPTVLHANAKYGAGIIVGSEWCEHHWTEVCIEPSVRDFVKLQRAYRDSKGKYFALPGSPTVCTCVGIGNTPQAAIKQAKDVVSKIKCSGMSFNTSALDKLLEETVPAGKRQGIPF